MKRLLTTACTTALVATSMFVATEPSGAAPPPPSYAVILLDPSADFPNSYATGLNNDGTIVGVSSDWYRQDTRLTYWDSNPRPYFHALEPSQAAAVDVSSQANRVVADALDEAGDPAIWFADRDGTDYVTDPVREGVVNISGTGVAVTNGLGDASPFLLDGPDRATPLAAPQGYTSPVAGRISENGRFVAGLAQRDGVETPVLWADGVARALKAPSGARHLGAGAANDRGELVSCVGIPSTPSYYDAAGNWSKLPSFAKHRNTCAEVINNSGVIAGRSWSETSAGSESTAVVWHDGVIHDLNDLVVKNRAFKLIDVADINAQGQIVGTAELEGGDTRGFVASPSTATSIYSTPGLHNFNGRQWKTTCESYSQTIRCRTDILATTVRYLAGAYTRVTDWTFNNLTYAPSPRKLWANNPLGHTGSWTAKDGRRWRTDCDTPVTGGNGCRSYAQAKVATANWDRATEGWTYTVGDKWVLNNIVRFN